MLPASYAAGIVVLSVLPTMSLIARLLAKRSNGLLWSIDDTLLVLALTFLYVVVAVFVTSMAAGLVCQHITTLSMKELERTLLTLWLFRIPMAISLTLTRCAISIFFIRTFYTTMFPRLRQTAYLCMFASIALGLASIIGILLHCRPIRYNFTIPFENPNYCFKLKPFIITMAAVGIALDALTWSLPHCVVWALQLRLAHKLAITTIFAFGLLNIVIGGLRMNELTNIAYQGQVTYGIGTILMWAVAQTSTGIIVASCPHLRPLFEKIVPRRLTLLHTCKQQTPSGRPASIKVTTRIDVRPSPNSPPRASFHDGLLDPWAPTFDVERSATNPQHVVSCSGDSTRGCGCFC